MKVIEKVSHTISKYNMIFKDDRLLVALSGGPDSVCLLKVLSILMDELEISLNAIYIDHQLRHEESPLEIEFCRNLCNSLEIPFIVKTIDVIGYSQKEKISKQEAARELRYKSLYETAFELKADKIATGHTADDQVETLLIRLIKGSGPLGLSGIPPVRQKVIRPLIEVERAEIETFLADNNLSFVVDSSNLMDRYLRNKIRHVIMPEIKKINPSAVSVIQRTADIFRSEERYFDILVTKSMMKMISRKDDNTIELFLAPFEITDPVIIRRILRRAIDATKGLKGITFLHIEDIIRLLKTGKSGDRLYLPNDIRVIKGYSVLKITCEKPVRLSTYTINGPCSVYLKEASMKLSCNILDADGVDSLGDAKKTAVINADMLSFPLYVRAREKGDYFYPLGFGKKKKLQDYFVDEKVPRDERDVIPLLINNNGDIVWVVGYRIDERYKVDKTVKKVLKCNIIY